MDAKLPVGSRFCKCGACGEYFVGVSSFDQHRVGPSGDRSCLPDPAMRERGLRAVVKAKGAYWINS